MDTQPSRPPGAASAGADASPSPAAARGRPDPAGSLPDFVPAPLRYRKDGWTPERQRLYLAALAETGHAGKAARAVGMTAQSAARLLRRPEAASFRAACTAAYLGARRRWTMLRLDAARSRLRHPPRATEGSGFSSFKGAET